MLIELTLGKRVDIAGEAEAVRKGRLVVRDPSPTSDAALAQAPAPAQEERADD